MELLTALLAGFFWWLLLFRLWRSRRARACEAAGALLLEVKPARRVVISFRFVRAFVCLVMLFAGAQNVFMRFAADPFGMFTAYSFIFSLLAGFYFSIFLFFALPSGRWSIVAEVRERGILYGAERLTFAPWNEIGEFNGRDFDCT